jgi:hypothetical protein
MGLGLGQLSLPYVDPRAHWIALLFGTPCPHAGAGWCGFGAAFPGVCMCIFAEPLRRLMFQRKSKPLRGLWAFSAMLLRGPSRVACRLRPLCAQGLCPATPKLDWGSEGF